MHSLVFWLCILNISSASVYGYNSPWPKHQHLCKERPCCCLPVSNEAKRKGSRTAGESQSKPHQSLSTYSTTMLNISCIHRPPLLYLLTSLLCLTYTDTLTFYLPYSPVTPVFPPRSLFLSPANDNSFPSSLSYSNLSVASPLYLIIHLEILIHSKYSSIIYLPTTPYSKPISYAC